MMQAVILAAGSSTRTYPLTSNKPKPMLKVLDKTILEHNLDQLILTKKVSEAIIVVGYKKEVIMERVGRDYKGLKITYVIQEKLDGNGGAIIACKDFLKDAFMVINGDDMYSYKDMLRCLGHKYCVMTQEVKDPEKWGVFTLKEGKVESFEEKPQDPKSNHANVGLYVFDKKIFGFTLKPTRRKEIEITDYITFLVQGKDDVFCETVSDYWVPVGYPWHYLEANVFFLRKLAKEKNDKPVIEGNVEDNVTIRGFVSVGKNTIIKSGTYIEGPVFIGENCVIGPNAYLRPDTIIMEGVKTRAEIIDSVIMEGTTAKHECYLGHSVVGENCNIAAGTITADFRHDGKEHLTLVQGKKVDTKRRKLGAFIGDNVNTGIGTLIYPGRKIWPGKGTLPGDIVKDDIEG